MKCIVYKEKRKQYRHFGFPKDQEMRQKWMSSLDLRQDQIKTTSTVCSRHFSSNDFAEYHLKRIAIPKNEILNSFDEDDDFSDEDQPLTKVRCVDNLTIDHFRSEFGEQFLDIVKCELEARKREIKSLKQQLQRKNKKNDPKMANLKQNLGIF